MIFDFLGTFLELPGKWSSELEMEPWSSWLPFPKEFLYCAQAQTPSRRIDPDTGNKSTTQNASPGIPGYHFLRNSCIARKRRPHREELTPTPEINQQRKNACPQAWGEASLRTPPHTPCVVGCSSTAPTPRKEEDKQK